MKLKLIIMTILVAFLSLSAVVTYSYGEGGFGPAGNSVPPGLQDKGMPPGLSKQDKTPPGWSHGKKRGWTHHHNHPANIM